jgi:GT2 family glycosyltransferase
MSIPVIGVPVVSNPYWITRLLMSIDYPVDDLVIINNNGRGEIDEELDNLKKITHKFVKNIKVCHLPANIGCGGAWNFIIKCYMLAPYWVIVNDDVAFGSGLLEEMATKADADPDIGMIHGHFGDYNVGSWDLFLIRDHIIKQFGLFDENLYPAYCEDADYLMRFSHRPIKKILSLDSNYYHGHGDKTLYFFQDEDDAERYAGLLEAEDHPLMSVVEIDPELAVKTCKHFNYNYIIITPNDLVIPPRNDYFF